MFPLVTTAVLSAVQRSVQLLQENQNYSSFDRGIALQRKKAVGEIVFVI